jgi:hypothetical protein
MASVLQLAADYAPLIVLLIVIVAAMLPGDSK